MQNIAIEYDYYTLEQAREIIREENRQKAIKRAERKARRKAEAIYYIKQKLAALTLALVSIASIFIDYDIIVCVFLLPIAIYIFFTKEKVCMF